MAYRCAASAENDEQWIAISRTNELIEQICHEVTPVGDAGCAYKLFLTGSGNFRYDIYPDYKANRIGKPVPKHLAACKEFMIKEWDAATTEGYEADDAMAMEAGENRIICSIDKDLMQVPGLHFNFVTKVSETVSEIGGLRKFYTQLLVGDAGDNIKGVKGIGKVKAAQILDGCETEDDLFDAVRDTYNDDTSMLINGQLLWIWRKLDDIWAPLKLVASTQPEGAVEPESTQPTPEDATLSTEHGLT